MTIPQPGKRDFKYLCAYLLVAFVGEVSSSICYHLFHTSPNVINNVTDFFFFASVVMLFKERIPGKSINVIAYVLIGLYLVVALPNLFLVQGFHVMNTYTWAVSNVCIIIICIIYFYVLIQQLPTDSITKLPMFWIATAMLIYHSGTFILYLSADYLVRVLKDNLLYSNYIQVLLGYGYYIILAYALLLVRSQYKQKQLA